MIQARTERPAGTKALVLGLLLVAFMVLSLMLAAKPARASTTFTVNNTVDPGNGTCSASGCSLREAFTAANNTPGEDLIRFNILGGGVKTIEVSSPLPPISEAATVDGKLSTKPNRNFVVRFFSNPSGTDEGKTFIGQKKVTTTSKGKVPFTFSPPRKVGEGKAITATGAEGTSEFSAPRAVVAP